MRRFETKSNKLSGLSVTRSFKKYAHAGEDVTDVLDTDEDRVMLYYSHDNKTQSGLLKQSTNDYQTGRNWRRK
jgi:hypothetical protein